MIQLVQIPLHATLAVFLVLLWWRAEDRRPWRWLLVGAAVSAVQLILTIYWLGADEGWLRFVCVGVLPAARTACYLMWAVLIWRTETDQPLPRHRAG